ncbi:hypothetical protein PF010_g28304 [Phytophthora fragariae]|nr:hypothetical protein PF007_g28942 [Phytophthora fragariae]KAE9065189.1 hypothetical protein PF010_g28304 [Phytophthora fragariae]KAE9074072.1 hypothetical protein PF006_g28606 [Phytophthora fragariae]KAE9170798.1 hypothetical protein PF004_g27757 [Phytophthora fragariae]KAE9172097.1 hypothetical protein PF002_g29652 [Phytophthora fragariae]
MEVRWAQSRHHAGLSLLSSEKLGLLGLVGARAAPRSKSQVSSAKTHLLLKTVATEASVLDVRPYAVRQACLLPCWHKNCGLNHAHQVISVQ